MPLLTLAANRCYQIGLIMSKKLGLLGLMATMAAISQQHYEPENLSVQTKKGRAPIYPKDEQPKKGQFHYWFRRDGTFLNEKQSERMAKEECVFKCFSINDKNAIKKFNVFMQSCQTV